MKKKTSIPEIAGIVRRFNLEHSMHFHLAYHYTSSIHLNHMIFLHSYLYGMLLTCAATAQCIQQKVVEDLDNIGLRSASLITLFIIYLLYAILIFSLMVSYRPPGSVLRILVIRGLVAGYVLVVGLIAVCVHLTMHHSSTLKCWHVVLIGISVVIGSFICQLIGHFYCEQFMASPDVWHGFVVAPILEWVSFLFRLNFLPELEAVWNYVTEVRQRNQDK